MHKHRGWSSASLLPSGRAHLVCLQAYLASQGYGFTASLDSVSESSTSKTAAPSSTCQKHFGHWCIDHAGISRGGIIAVIVCGALTASHPCCSCCQQRTKLVVLGRPLTTADECRKLCGALPASCTSSAPHVPGASASQPQRGACRLSCLHCPEHWQLKRAGTLGLHVSHDPATASQLHAHHHQSRPCSHLQLAAQYVLGVQDTVPPSDRTRQGLGHSDNDPAIAGAGDASATLAPRGDLHKQG